MGWKEGGDDARRARFPNFIGCAVSVVTAADDEVGVGGSIVTSSPYLTVVLDRLLAGEESVKSTLENFADGRRERIDVAVVWV